MRIGQKDRDAIERLKHIEYTINIEFVCLPEFSERSCLDQTFKTTIGVIGKEQNRAVGDQNL